MSYVQTTWLAETNEWIIRLVDVVAENLKPFSLATFADGSFVAFRHIALHDFDENGWFRADVP